MPSSLSLPARKNGRRLARDSAGNFGDFDIHTLSAWAQDNLTPGEIGRVIAMLQTFLDKPKDDAEAKRPDVGGMDSRIRAASAKGFASRYPAAGAIKRMI